jgi:hypothetical protein
MEDKKLCPLKRFEKDVYSGTSYTYETTKHYEKKVTFGECEESKCAWFDEHYNKCSMQSLGGIAYNLCK